MNLQSPKLSNEISRKKVHKKHISNGKMNTITNFAILWKHINIILSKKLLTCFAKIIHSILNQKNTQST